MSLTDNKIISLGKSLLNLAKEEYGQDIITKNKLRILCRSDELAKTIISSSELMSDKIKIIYAAEHNQFNKTKEEIIKIINDLYFVVIDYYDDVDYIKNECNECYGEGNQDCYKCAGTGEEDCRTCDGDGTIDCDSCSGDGVEDCRYCDGKGTETEEDDEGDEIEVECVHCKGSGHQDCRDCGGNSNFECPTCDGGGNESCGECDGSGVESCYRCGGSGEVQSDEEYYTITKRRMVTVGNKVEKYDGECMLLKKFEKKDANNEMLINEFTISQSSYDDDVPEDERNSSVGMDDYFVEIVDVLKLERVNERLRF